LFLYLHNTSSLNLFTYWLSSLCLVNQKNMASLVSVILIPGIRQRAGGRYLRWDHRDKREVAIQNRSRFCWWAKAQQLVQQWGTCSRSRKTSTASKRVRASGGKEFGFYSKCGGKPLKRTKQSGDMPGFTFLHHCSGCYVEEGCSKSKMEAEMPRRRIWGGQWGHGAKSSVWSSAEPRSQKPHSSFNHSWDLWENKTAARHLCSIAYIFPGLFFQKPSLDIV
jgi:hypothetical protein